LLQPKAPSSWRRDIERSVARWWRTTERRAMLPAHPVNPQRVFWELSPLIPDEALVACDTGTAAFWYARNLRLRPGMRTAHSGGLASMGAGLPYAIAAKFAYPELPAFAFVGDGAMQMNGLNELITVGKYWRRWDNPRFVVLVLNNRDLSMVSWEQRVLEGDPKFSASQDVPDFSYSDYATQVGMKGILIDRPQFIADAWRDALTADRPVLVEALVDGNVPLLPPHISAGQARNYLSAILHGDRDAIKIIRSSIREILA
jgi:pyruvate dehydrogenase (quinone)